MESPLSAVMTSLFMKVLGNEHYWLLIMKATKWFRYVVDVLVIINNKTYSEAK